MDIELKQIKELLLKVVNCNWHGQQHVLCDLICACPCYGSTQTARNKECGHTYKCECPNCRMCLYHCGIVPPALLKDIPSESEMGRPMEKCPTGCGSECPCCKPSDSEKAVRDKIVEILKECPYVRPIKVKLEELVKLAREGKA